MGGQITFPGGSLYQRHQMGIEGILDTVAPEVAVFGNGCTLVEPGGGRTDFRHRSARVAPMLEAYNASPSRMANRIIADTIRPSPGDPAKMVEAMIASVDQELVFAQERFYAIAGANHLGFPPVDPISGRRNPL
jgi:hypothetical protein